MYAKDAGKLYIEPTRSGGKVIDEWKFISPFRDKGAPKLTVKISINKSERDDYHFEASSDSLPGIIRNSDINALRTRVEAALRHQHDVLTRVIWEDWLEVEVRGHREDELGIQTVRADLHITYRKLKRGVHPDTGAVYVINFNGIAMPFPSAKKAGEADPDVEDDGSERLKDYKDYIMKGLGRGRERMNEYSYVPATPENIAALEDIMVRLGTLRQSLAAFLSQDTVSTSLQGLNNLHPALAAPL